MKKIAMIMAMLMCVSCLTACGNDKIIDGKMYETKGILTLDEKDPNIQYKVIVGNVVWSVLLCETFVFPIYFVGFSLYEPVGKK